MLFADYFRVVLVDDNLVGLLDFVLGGSVWGFCLCFVIAVLSWVIWCFIVSWCLIDCVLIFCLLFLGFVVDLFDLVWFDFGF